MISINSSMPVFFNADILIVVVCRYFSRIFSSILIFFFSSISDIFNAIITFVSSSNNWVVKYRLLSIDVASTILIIKSGCSSIAYFRDTSSSAVYGDNEYIPGKSTIVISVPLIFPSFLSIVTPGQLPTFWFVPVKTLNRLVLPLFWFPTNATFITLLPLCRYSPYQTF